MEKQRWEESRRRRKEVRRSEKRKREKKEDAGARKGRKVVIHWVFPMICGSGGSRSRLAKAAGAEPTAQMRDEKLHAAVVRSTFPSQKCKKLTSSDHFWPVEMSKKCTPLLREAHCPSQKSVRNWRVRTTFWRSDVEQVHAVVVQSTFPSQKCKKLTSSDHFRKLRCRKSARRCCAKHISKAKKCQKLTSSDHFLTFRCRKVHAVVVRSTFPSQKCKNWQVRTTFGSWDVEKVHAVVARSTLPSQKCKKLTGSDHFWRSDVVLRGRRKGLCTLPKVSKTWQFCGSFNYNTTTTPIRYTTLHYIKIRYATLHNTTLHYTTLHYSYTTLHLTTLHYIALHYTTLDYTTLHYTLPHYTTLLYASLH